jgi:hypothetical protein
MGLGHTNSLCRRAAANGATLFLLLGIEQPAPAQELSISPSHVRVESRSTGSEENTWQIGPILLALPNSWTDAAGRATASLKGPDDTVVTFVALEATRAGRETGYSFLSDKSRGPDAFGRFVQWDDCLAGAKRTIAPLTIAAGGEAMVAECLASAHSGSSITYAQISLYSTRNLVQIHAAGSRRSVDVLLQSLRRLKWTSGP